MLVGSTIKLWLFVHAVQYIHIFAFPIALLHVADGQFRDFKKPKMHVLGMNLRATN